MIRTWVARYGYVWKKNEYSLNENETKLNSLVDFSRNATQTDYRFTQELVGIKHRSIGY